MLGLFASLLVQTGSALFRFFSVQPLWSCLDFVDTGFRQRLHREIELGHYCQTVSVDNSPTTRL